MLPIGALVSPTCVPHGCTVPLRICHTNSRRLRDFQEFRRRFVFLQNDHVDPRKKFLKRVEFDQSISSLKQYLRVFTGENTVTLYQEVPGTAVASATSHSFVDHSYYLSATGNSATGDSSTPDARTESTTSTTMLETNRRQGGSCEIMPEGTVALAPSSGTWSSSSTPNRESGNNSNGNASPVSDSKTGNKKRTGSGSSLIIGLEGKDLYVCGMTGKCDSHFNK